VAAYRIAVEAMTNTVRHARASHGTIDVQVGESLRVDIADDGVGIPAAYRGGVGIASMRERAEELGGSCLVQPLLPRGTLVQATIPLPAS
jgi:signal transduction histidine kinase